MRRKNGRPAGETLIWNRPKPGSGCTIGIEIYLENHLGYIPDGMQDFT